MKEKVWVGCLSRPLAEKDNKITQLIFALTPNLEGADRSRERDD